MEDFVLILFVKLLIITLGNYLLLEWIERKRTTLKLIFCWFISFCLNLVLVFTIYDGILPGPPASLLSIFTFFILSKNLFKKR